MYFEHSCQTSPFGTYFVSLNFFSMSRSLANVFAEHILTALSPNLLLLVFGMGTKLQILMCVFPFGIDSTG